MPVAEQGKLIGIVSIGDVVKNRVEEIEREAAALRDYIQHRRIDALTEVFDENAVESACRNQGTRGRKEDRIERT